MRKACGSATSPTSTLQPGTPDLRAAASTVVRRSASTSSASAARISSTSARECWPRSNASAGAGAPRHPASMLLDNQAESVTGSLRELGKAGLEGTLMSVLVLFFFLRDWPSTLMVSLAIPICLVITLGCMYFFGMTLNILSMMGLLLARRHARRQRGRRRRKHLPLSRKISGQASGTAQCRARRSCGMAIAAGTLTSIIVFLPNGVRRSERHHRSSSAQVAITMSIAHLASWLVAVSLVPMLSAKSAAAEIHRSRNSHHAPARALRPASSRWTLAHRRWTMVGVFALLIASIVPITQTKKDMFDSGESRRLYLHYDLNANYRLEDLKPAIAQMEALSRQESRALRDQDDVHVLHRAGRGADVRAVHGRRQGQALRERNQRGHAQGNAGARGRQSRLRLQQQQRRGRRRCFAGRRFVDSCAISRLPSSTCSRSSRRCATCAPRTGQWRPRSCNASRP